MIMREELGYEPADTVKGVYVRLWQTDWWELINSDGRWRMFCIGYSLTVIGRQVSFRHLSEGSARGATEEVK